MHEKRRGFSGAIAVVALIIAIIALVVAWMAYERTGADLDQRIQEAFQGATQSVEEGVQQGTDALDAGPDGVDEDDTQINTQPSTNQQ